MNPIIQTIIWSLLPISELRGGIPIGLASGLTPGIDDEATPACVVACKVGARTFGDLNDPESNVSQLLANNPSYRLREGLGTNPRVYYLPAREEAL